MYDVIFTALGGEYKKSNKQTKWLPAPATGLQMFPTRKFLKLKLVQSLSQRKMQQSMASNFLKVFILKLYKQQQYRQQRLKYMQQLVETFIINLSTEWFAQQTEFKTEFESMEIHEMNNCLSKFYLSARKQDGSHYKKTSLLSIRAALDRYLTRNSQFVTEFSLTKQIKR